MQTRERQAQEQRDAALVNRLVPPTPPPARDSEPLMLEATPQDHTWDDDPDDIFRSAVSEIETQPLLPQPQEVSWPVVVLLVVFLVSFVGGTVMALMTYPTVTIEVVPVTRSVSVTMPLALPTRALTPVTLTISLTGPATGKGHQDARAATGTLIFYNGLFTAQTIPVGTVFTGADGVKIATEAAVTIPAGNPPSYGHVSVEAQTLQAGSTGNIPAGDITTTVSSGVLVKNGPFRGGRDARDFQVVAQSDLDRLTSALQTTLSQRFPQAFILRPVEAVQPTRCTFTVTPHRPAGAEAQTVTLHATETCAGLAYNGEQMSQQATALFTQQTGPGANYQLVGEVLVRVIGASPLTVSCRGLWAFTLSLDYEQFLAEQIAGNTPAQAKAYLLRTGFLTYAMVPKSLPKDPGHIKFETIIGL